MPAQPCQGNFLPFSTIAPHSTQIKPVENAIAVEAKKLLDLVILALITDGFEKFCHVGGLQSVMRV